MRKTWKCPKCDSCYDGDAPVVCRQCRLLMQIWNISDDSRRPRSPIAVGELDYPLYRWLEDRPEDTCSMCNVDLKTLDPQAFVAMVMKDGFSFPVGVICDDCYDSVLV